MFDNDNNRTTSPVFMRQRDDKIVSSARVLTVCLMFYFRLPLGNFLHRVQVFLPH